MHVYPKSFINIQVQRFCSVSADRIASEARAQRNIEGRSGPFSRCGSSCLQLLTTGLRTGRQRAPPPRSRHKVGGMKTPPAMLRHSPSGMLDCPSVSDEKPPPVPYNTKNQFETGVSRLFTGKFFVSKLWPTSTIQRTRFAQGKLAGVLRSE